MARHLNRPLIGLGFAGNARMEVAMADLLGELNPSVYIVDCLPNMGVEQIHQRFQPFLRTLRSYQPSTPILFVGDRVFGDHAFQPQRGHTWQAKNAALAAEFSKAEGDKNIALLPGQNFFGSDTNGTCDGSHPNDLGSHRMAMCVADALTQRRW